MAKPKLFHSDYQKQWSEGHKYQHQTTGEYCTFAAFVAEYLILRREDAFKNPKPSYKFWSKGDKFHLMFLRQVRAVNKLLKKYPEHIILGAIKSPHFDNVFFLGLSAKVRGGMKLNEVAVKAIESYNKEQEELAKQKEAAKNINLQPEVEKKELKTRRTQSYKKSKSSLNQLRNM